MLMHISFFSDPLYFRTYLFQIHCSVNLPDRLRVGRLDSDLQLDQSRTHPADQFDFLLIQKSGAAMSHHHGIGKMFGPWLEGAVGRNEYGVIRALKQYFDPDNIMNPGGTLGLDVPQEEKRFLKAL